MSKRFFMSVDIQLNSLPFNNYLTLRFIPITRNVIAIVLQKGDG